MNGRIGQDRPSPARRFARGVGFALGVIATGAAFSAASLITGLGGIACVIVALGCVALLVSGTDPTVGRIAFAAGAAIVGLALLAIHHRLFRDER